MHALKKKNRKNHFSIKFYLQTCSLCSYLPWDSFICLGDQLFMPKSIFENRPKPMIFGRFPPQISRFLLSQTISSKIKGKSLVFKNFSILRTLMLEIYPTDHLENCTRVGPHASVCAKKFWGTVFTPFMFKSTREKKNHQKCPKNIGFSTHLKNIVDIQGEKCTLELQKLGISDLLGVRTM